MNIVLVTTSSVGPTIELADTPDHSRINTAAIISRQLITATFDVKVGEVIHSPGH